MVHDESCSVLGIPREQLASPSSSMFMRCFPTKRKKTDNELVLRYENEHTVRGNAHAAGAPCPLTRTQTLTRQVVYSTSRTVLESFQSRTLKYGVSAGLPKR